MVEKVKWNFNLSIEKGPSISLTDSLDTDAYDKISVTIAKNATVPIDVQPSGSGKIDFMCIKSDQYSQSATKKITYKCGATGQTEINLDRDHVLIGSSLIELLEEVPTKLTFNNKTDNPANVEILIGRRAV